jgi:hypothetical protein
MGKNKSKSGGRNDDRPNGKAWKKTKAVQKNTGKTLKGYSPAKISIRATKRSGDR